MENPYSQLGMGFSWASLLAVGLRYEYWLARKASQVQREAKSDSRAPEPSLCTAAFCVIPQRFAQFPDIASEQLITDDGIRPDILE